MARKTSFYYSFLVLPPEQRRAIIAVWDFCRAVDDAVDEPAEVASVPQLTAVGGGGGEGFSALPPDPHAASRLALDGWRAELARCYEQGVPLTEQGRNLQPFIRTFDLPRGAFEDVIDGVAMDLDTTRYETFDDLLEYCHRVASAVGIICINIFGCTHPSARQYALDLGVALQLTNIVRDVKDDLDKGRVYLPLEDLRAAGCRVEDLAAGVVTEPVKRLLAFQCRRAHDFYERAMRSRPSEQRRRLVAAEIMRAVYYETLLRIEQNDYDVFSARTRVPKPVQALIALRQWAWSR
ncbi:MAG: phytoene/squalene synthase family protein [Vicinamibacterales bacterium]